MDGHRRHLPLAAIVGQERLRTAYLAAVVHPGIGGLLISGPKGTGKSTAVHAVEGILPEFEAVDGCPFQCDPARPERHCSDCRQREEIKVVRRPMRIVSLPLSCTEDRLIGSIQIEALLREGRLAVQPGILAEANRNILYVDEVNLLPDHLVDDILDAAAGHWNTIEREGVSFSHPTDFVLVGTMNPEEGELRPQILDRFPLCLRLDSVTDPDARVEIIRRNLLFERSPDQVHGQFAEEQERLRLSILRGRERLSGIEIPDAMLLAVATTCAELKVDGQRPDIVIVKTAAAITALRDAGPVSPTDLFMAAELALNHRTRDGGLLDPPSREEIRESLRSGLARAAEAGASKAAMREVVDGTADPEAHGGSTGGPGGGARGKKV